MAHIKLLDREPHNLGPFTRLNEAARRRTLRVR
jgi:hypothetical protein